MMIIREATESDVGAIWKLGQSVLEFSVNSETVNFWPQEIIQNIVSSNEAVVLVAEEETEVRGFIIANCNKAFRKVIIENIYVSFEVRNLGIGERLLSQLLSLVEKDGYEYIATLIPVEAHGASRFYIDSGFTKGEIFQWFDQSLSSNFRSK